MKIAYAYIRTGRSRRGSIDGGLEAQTEESRRYYEEFLEPLGYEYGGEFVDDVTERHVRFPDRKAGSLLWPRLLSGDFLICALSSRMFRGVPDLMRCVLELESRGVRFHLLDVGLRNDTREGVAECGFLRKLDLWRSLRVTDSLANADRSTIPSPVGLFVKTNCAPIGMKRVNLRGKEVYVSDPEVRAIMGLIHDWRESGCMLHEIVRRLHRRRIRINGKKWTPRKVAIYYAREIEYRQASTCAGKSDTPRASTS